MNTIQHAAHAVAPSVFKAEPTMSPSMRGKMGAASAPMGDSVLSSASNLLSNIKTGLVGPNVDANGIPIPPPQPTREMLHKHYLIPKAPPMPTAEDFHGHYLIPKAPPMPTAEQMNKHYLSRDRTLENASNILSSLYTRIAGVASDLKATAPSAADLGLATRLDERGIPIPPPQPTREMLHKHYLIPKAPPMPTAEDFHGHYLIPQAPPLPVEGEMNKHYLSRDKTVENAKDTVRSYVNYASEVAEDLKNAAVSSLPSTSGSTIPVPPPLPTAEDFHGHYLTRPVVRSNRSLPSDMTENERLAIQNAYRQEPIVAASPMFSVNKFKRFASGAASYLNVFSTADMSSQSHIPVPPPLPTREDMHKHYLIPVPPRQPTDEMMNKHYLSRNKTIENAGSVLSHAVSYVTEVVNEVKDYVLETPISDMPVDLKERLNAKPLDANGIPIPPPLPTREAMHKHYLIPLAPPPPRRGQMNKHYLSRNKALENAGSSIRSAATLATEVVSDVSKSIVDGSLAAKDIVIDRSLAAKDAVIDRSLAAKDAVVETASSLPSATQLGDKAASSIIGASEAARETLSGAVQSVVGSGVSAKPAQKGTVYSRSEVISESPILKKNSSGARRIMARSDYSGFQPLLRTNSNSVRI